MPAHSTVTYRLDEGGLLVECGGAWDAFARANGGAEVTMARILGRPIWDFVAGSSTRQLWHELLDAARRRGGLVIPFRCDAPDRRRYMVMTIEPQTDGTLLLASAVAREERRPPQRWLDYDAGRRDEAAVIVSCSWCRRFLVEDEWLEVEDAVARSGLLEGATPSISHGICPTCAETLIAQLA
jgi:hypothetical protein